MDLPAVIPIFPLPNVVLFPGVRLPLHIFEPRYRQMVSDVAASHELIGMALLRGEWQANYHDRPDIFEIGCAGRVVQTERLPEGRFNILLEGLCEFDIREQSFDQPYRQARIEWWSRRPDIIPVETRQHLIDRIQRILPVQRGGRAQQLLADGSLSDEQLVNFFCYVLDLPAREKQGLLQERLLAARAARLSEMLDFHLAEADLGAATVPDRDH